MRPIDLLIAILVPISLGIGFVVAKPVVTDFPPILLMGLRFVVAALALGWFVRRSLHLGKPMFMVALIGASMQYGFTFYGLRELDAGITSLILQAEVPFLVLIAAFWLKEPLQPRKLVGLLVAFAGIYLVSGQPELAGSLHGVALVLTGAFLWALGQVMVRRLGDVGGLTVTAWLAVLAAPQLLVMSLLMEQGQWQAMSTAGMGVWAAVLYLGLVMTAIGYVCWYHVLGKYSAARVAPFLLLTPVSSVIGGVVFLGEPLTRHSIVGGLLVVSGVALLLLQQHSGSPVAPVRPSDSGA